MGLIRKTTSLSTLGLVNYHSPREKQAIAASRSSRAQKEVAKAEAKLLKEQARLLEAQRKALSE